MENSNSNSTTSSWNMNRMILERGVVGLGIVAAMSMSNINNSTDVVSSAKPAANFRGTTNYGLFYASPLNTGTRFLFPTPHFLNSCNLCHKLLHGVDIFIYSGFFSVFQVCPTYPFLLLDFCFFVVDTAEARKHFVVQNAVRLTLQSMNITKTTTTRLLSSNQFYSTIMPSHPPPHPLCLRLLFLQHETL